MYCVYLIHVLQMWYLLNICKPCLIHLECFYGGPNRCKYICNRRVLILSNTRQNVEDIGDIQQEMRKFNIVSFEKEL